MNVRSGLGCVRLAVEALAIPLALVVLGCLMAGCQGSLLSYRGGTVSPGESIELLEGEHSAYWPTRDLRINYTYSKNSNQLNLSGNVKFADWLGFSFNNILVFNLQVFLLNDQGTVLQAAGLATSPSYAQAQSLLNFTKTMSLPPGTTAMAFGYTGEARGTGDDDSGTTSFFYIPVAR